jgi:long-chain acyl-CoA synthetase
MYQAEELLHVLRDSGAETIFIFDQLLPVIEEIKNETAIKAVISVSFEGGCAYNQLLQDDGDTVPSVSINAKEDMAVLQYTGGTTGRSKGAMLTHYNLVANTVQSAATATVKTNVGKERVLGMISLFHVYGMTSAMNLTFYNGGNLILMPRFDVSQAVKVIEKTKPTIFPGVPTMYIALLNYYRKAPFDLSSLTTCTSGSAPLPEEIMNRFNQISGTAVAEGFGLSEASPVTHRNPVEGLQKIGSIGIPVPNTDAKIVDSALGEEALPTGEVGELIIKGPQIMKGYLGLPEETAHALRDGWLYTGDLARMDEDGFFYIVGRKKDMIIASGYNVYPVEIENVLYTHPKILEAAVVGVPDKYRGETIQAVIVPKDTETVSKEEIIQFCRKYLSAYKIPRRITFVDELPKTAVGKILKRTLREQMSQ